MKEIYILTRCVDIKSDCLHFHFRGFYYGKQINRIISKRINELVTIGDDYFIKANVLFEKDKELAIEIIKIKNIDQIKIIPQK